MTKDSPVRNAVNTAESSGAADAFEPMRSWDPVYFAFYPVGQIIRVKVQDREGDKQRITTRSSDGTEAVFSGAA